MRDVALDVGVLSALGRDPPGRALDEESRRVDAPQEEERVDDDLEEGAVLVQEDVEGEREEERV